jgi:hypothetical protein
MAQMRARSGLKQSTHVYAAIRSEDCSSQALLLQALLLVEAVGLVIRPSQYQAESNKGD